MQRRYRKPKPQKELVKKFRANHQIKVPNVFVITDSGEKLGVMPTSEALMKAEQQELDLVEVSPQTDPPVAKIMDYGQYKYEREKQARIAKAHQKVSETKSIRLSFRIKGQDLETRRKQALKFLEGGNKVKINTILKGREKAHRAIAIENIKEFITSLGEDIKIVQPVTPQGGQINATISKS